jgi:hypothetical protein
MLPEWELIYLTYVATVLAAMLGNYVIDMGGSMTLAELDLFYYQWLLGFNLIFNHWNIIS